MEKKQKKETIRLYDLNAKKLDSFEEPELMKIQKKIVEGRLVIDLEFHEMAWD